MVASNPFMRQALDLAWEICGTVGPRPPVGAVLVSGDEVIARGHTEPRPGRHAEMVALDAAGARAKGATMHCTMEPHSVRSLAKPCAQAIAEAGVAKVVAAIKDPSPAENGRGAALLREAGVTVEFGSPSEAREAQELAEGFEKHAATKLPFVTVKMALTLDGRLADDSGEARWISGSEARKRGHALRRRADAVLTGIGTVLADDPRLTARDDGGSSERQPLRVVMDSGGRMPPSARLLDQPGRTLWFTAEGVKPAFSKERLEHAHAPASNEGLDLKAVMAELGRRGATWVLAEAGGKLLGSLLGQGLADRVEAFVAPKLLLGQGARRVQGRELPIADALRLRRVRHEALGDDMLVSGYLD